MLLKLIFIFLLFNLNNKISVEILNILKKRKLLTFLNLFFIINLLFVKIRDVFLFNFLLKKSKTILFNLVQLKKFEDIKYLFIKFNLFCFKNKINKGIIDT